MTSSNLRLSREFSRFSKFTVVGAIGAVVDFGIFNLLHTVLGVVGNVAQAVSFCAAVTSNFLWNRYWTYPDSRSKPVPRQALQFAFVNVIGLLLRTPIFSVAERPMAVVAGRMLSALPPTVPPGPESFLPIQAQVLGSNFALAAAVLVVLFWNFAANRIWTYSDVS